MISFGVQFSENNAISGFNYRSLSYIWYYILYLVKMVGYSVYVGKILKTLKNIYLLLSSSRISCK